MFESFWLWSAAPALGLPSRQDNPVNNISASHWSYTRGPCGLVTVQHRTAPTLNQRAKTSGNPRLVSEFSFLFSQGARYPGIKEELSVHLPPVAVSIRLLFQNTLRHGDSASDRRSQARGRCL